MSRVCIGPGTNFTTAVAVDGRDASNLITSPEREREREKERKGEGEREKEIRRERGRKREIHAYSRNIFTATTASSARRAARAVAAAGVGIDLLGSPFLLHIIAETVCIVTAFGGRDASGERARGGKLRSETPVFISTLSVGAETRVFPFRMYRNEHAPCTALSPHASVSLSLSLSLSLAFVPRSPPPFHSFSASTPLVVLPLLWRRKRLLFTLYFQTNTIPTFAKVMAMLVGMAALVARRLALMRDHWAASKPGVGKTADDPGATGVPNRPSKETVATAAAAKGESSSGASAAVSFCGGGGGGGSGGIRGGSEVVEAGVFLLALEVSAMLWLAGGWSSLVALRFRCTFRVYRRDSENTETPPLTHFSI